MDCVKNARNGQIPSSNPSNSCIVFFCFDILSLITETKIFWVLVFHFDFPANVCLFFLSSGTLYTY